MALSNTTVRAIYTANGVTTSFAIPHDRIQSTTAEVEVYTADQSVDPATETLITQGTGATQYGISGSNVVFVTAPASGIKVVVQRTIALTQPTDLTTNGAFDAETVEETLDRLVAEIQLVNHKLRRVPLLRTTIPDSKLDMDITDPAALSYLRWNSAADGIESGSTTSGTLNIPGSSTDNAIARWDGTGGNSVQNSGLTIDDTNAIGGTIPSATITTLTNTTLNTTTVNATSVIATTGTFTKPTVQRLTTGTGATYTLPAGCKWLEVFQKAAGGGGGEGATAASNGGGGGGAGNLLHYIVASPSATGTYTIGPGGAGGSGGGPNNGSNGSNTTFTMSGQTNTANGGSGGGSSVTGSGGAGGTAGTLNFGTLIENVVGNGGSASVSDGGGIGGSGLQGGSGRGIQSGTGTAGGTNTGAGGGGGGGTSGDGGAGADGVIIVIEHYA